MTRDQKIEAMAREWCLINGWVPDHRPTGIRIVGNAWPPEQAQITDYVERPIWTRHTGAMDRLLKSIGE